MLVTFTLCDCTRQLKGAANKMFAKAEKMLKACLHGVTKLQIGINCRIEGCGVMDCQ